MERKQMGPDFMEHGVLVSMRISLAMFYVLLKTCYCVVRTVFLLPQVSMNVYSICSYR